MTIVNIIFSIKVTIYLNKKGNYVSQSPVQKRSAFMADAATDSYNAGKTFGRLLAQNNDDWTYSKATAFV